MGLLVEGKWQDKWYDTKSNGGKFKRQESSFRNKIGDENFKPEKSRYHLYVSLACPWAHRALIMRKLKKLEDVISLTIVNPYMGSNGWQLDEDPINNKQYLYEVYLKANDKYTGRVTVPVLWDKHKNTIVNNESSEIIRFLNSKFNEFTDIKYDYYPEDLQNEIDNINDFVYKNINNGVYKAGFATDQKVYALECKKLFESLDYIENLLVSQEYLVGNKITEADIRLFTTLIRFDHVYYGHFKCNIRQLLDYKNISNYVRRIYNIDGVSETVNFMQIKEHYYKSHPQINPNAIVPVGPNIDFRV